MSFLQQFLKSLRRILTKKAHSRRRAARYLSPLQRAVLDTLEPRLLMTTTASSIDLVTSTPTNLSAVDYAVTFSAAVTGVTTSDFSLAETGSLTGASVRSVSGSGDVYTVTVNTGAGSGTLGLNLVDDDSIVDGSLAPLGGVGKGNGNDTGQVYTFDRSSPSIDIESPSADAFVAGNTPTISGIAGVASGDSTAVTVYVYMGSSAIGNPLQTLSATANATTGAYSVDVPRPWMTDDIRFRQRSLTQLVTSA